MASNSYIHIEQYDSAGNLLRIAHRDVRPGFSVGETVHQLKHEYTETRSDSSTATRFYLMPTGERL